jgi:protein-tyrosine phosphatase
MVTTRRLAWSALLNARDLGGLPTGAGGTRPGAVARSDALGRLTDEGRAALLAHGVRTIVDLRSETEVRTAPGPFRDHPGYRNLAFIDEAGLASLDRFELGADSYLWQLESQAVRVAAVLRAVADAPAGGVLVHCAAGKDRTGMVAALLLTVAGVERQVVAEDYALSAAGLVPMLEEALAAEPDPAGKARLRRMFTAPPGAMLGLLENLDGRYGGVEGYLEWAGVGPETRARLRQRLTGPLD